MPIRSRIALAIFGVSTLALIVMSVAVYAAFERNLQLNFDDTLRARSAAAASLVDVAAIPIVLRVTSDPGGEQAQGESFLRLYDRAGRLVSDAAPAVGTSPAEAALVARAATDGEAIERVAYSGGEQFRVVASPIYANGALVGVLLTGLETSRVEQPLETLRVVLLLAIPLTGLVLAGASFYVARRALRPIAAITASAQRIAAGNLRDRIAGTPTQDEVGELSSAFNQMVDRLAETMERERRFTADAAHELRTPLAAMESTVDVTLSQQRPADDYRRALESVRGQTQRLVRLTRHLLLLSRLDAEAFQASFEPIDLAALVRAVTDSFADSHPRATITLTGISAEIPMRADSELLARAISNLLENAVLHAAPDVRIALDVTVHASRVSIFVADDGPGIPPALAEHIFARFSRGDVARSPGGTGLGLAIVDAIARLHGGSVALLLGEQGMGARFEITLPL